MQQRSVLITSIVLAIAVALGIIYLLSTPSVNFDAEPTPTPTFRPTTTPTPLLTTPTPLATPQTTPNVNGSSVTAETGTSEWLIVLTLAAILFGSLNLVRQFKRT